ncbi:MAG: hypothetical protein JRC99_00055 [Deltaproteobacteria bacterium]|nr:hypothetical protein [Deltaproteobacteria bacterium]
MIKIVSVGEEKIVIRTLSVKRIGAFSKRYAAMQEISANTGTASEKELLSVQDFFTQSLSHSDEIMVQLLSARLVNAGIHEDIFLESVEDLDGLMSALPLSEDTGDLDALLKAWEDVNPDFLSWSAARMVGPMITRLCRRVGIQGKAKKAPEKVPAQVTEEETPGPAKTEEALGAEVGAEIAAARGEVKAMREAVKGRGVVLDAERNKKPVGATFGTLPTGLGGSLQTE